jgi:hypothetical protein
MAFLLLATAVARPASAVPITTWDIAGSNGQTAAVLASEPLTSATGLLAFNVTPWPGGFCCFTAASGWTLAFDPSRYYEFSVTADPGHSIAYESITLSLFRGIQGAQHGAESWELRSSADTFGSALASFDISSSAADEQVLFSGVDISALGTLPGTLIFRLYGFDYTSPTDYSGLGNHPGPILTGTGSNLVIEGLVTPEPGTAVLVAVGLVALGLRRRPGR